MIQRRGFLTGLLATPFIVRTPGLLMPVRVQPRMTLEFDEFVKLQSFHRWARMWAVNGMIDTGIFAQQNSLDTPALTC